MRLVSAVIGAMLVAASSGRNAPVAFAHLLERPFGQASAMRSPDGRYALWGDYPHSQLWIENTATKSDRLVGAYTVQTISLAWAPDSRRFIVNDRETSSESDAFLFDTETLQRIDLRQQLLARFPEVAHFLLSGQPAARRAQVSHERDVMHSYVDARRWIDARHLELQVHGNFAGRFRDDNPDERLYPAGCFDLRFLLGLDGSVQELSQRTSEPLSKDPACGWGPRQ
jgi:hypothetical protein